MIQGYCGQGGGLVDKLKVLIASWVSILPDFQGVSVDLIMYCWREVAFPFMMD